MEELDTRKRIYEEIVMNPGLHFRELMKRLNIPVGMLEYHLHILERDGLIISKQEGKYRRYFANTHMSMEERRVVSHLRGEIQRKIVIYLLENGKSRHGDISQGTGIIPSLLSYHLKKLVDGGILIKENAGRESFYYVKNEELVTAILIKYRKSFIDSLVDNFVSWYLSN